MENYKILKAKNTTALQSQVNNHISDGWSVHGNPMAFSDDISQQIRKEPNDVTELKYIESRTMDGLVENVNIYIDKGWEAVGLQFQFGDRIHQTIILKS